MIIKVLKSLRERGFKKTIIISYSHLVSRFYSALMKAQLQYCGPRFFATYPMTIHGGENIFIGSNFRSMGSTYLYGNEGSITIGDNLSLSTNVIINSSGGKIEIGSNVLIGPNTVLRAANHGLLRDELINTQPHDGGVISIKDDVWLGSNVVVLRNMTIGAGTVVAAGSVVTKDTEPYSIVSGTPARKIGERKRTNSAPTPFL